MSLFQSLNVTTNTTNQLSKKMEVVGDNINNAGTTGFKGSRAEFSEMLSNQSMGADGGNQVGSGAVYDKSTRDLAQGTLRSSESATDLAIDGNGHFAVEAPFGRAYSRDGSFHFDKEGFLVNSDGHKVLGFNGEEGKESNAVAPLKISKADMAAQGTTKVNLSMNLDAREDIKVFDPLNPDESSNFHRSVTILDNKGKQRSIDVYFTKTAPGVWTYNAMANGKELEPAIDGKQLIGSGNVNFDAKGVMVNDSGLNATGVFKDSGEQSFNISLTNKGEKSTQYGTDSAVSHNTRDGHEKGGVLGIGFDHGGALTLRYNNGKSIQLGKVAIAKFPSEQGLRKVGDNLYVGNASSGQVSMGQSGVEGRGNILNNSLEESNVDITDNFVDLMTTQKTFSANSQAMTAIDSLLQNVIALR